MTRASQAGLALAAGLLLLAAAEAPIRDHVEINPGPGLAEGEARPPEPVRAPDGPTAPRLVRIDGPATAIPVPAGQPVAGAAGRPTDRDTDNRDTDDRDTDEEVRLAEPEAPQRAMPRPRTLAEAVDRLRHQPETALDAEARCLAKAVFWEARGEPLSGQLAVAQVILNRVESRRFGRDVCAVVTAPRQFSFVRGGQIPEASNRHQWATAKAIALLALEGDWDDVVGSATHFHAAHVRPGWRMVRVATIGNHIFYR